MKPLVAKKMIAPPNYLDGAKVIKWAWAKQNPFGYVANKDGKQREEIYGLAICQYEKNKSIYRFSCNKKWNTVQDEVYSTVEDAIKQLPEQYKNVKVNWQTK